MQLQTSIGSSLKSKGDTYEQKKAILAIFMMAFLIIIGFILPSIWKSQKGNKKSEAENTQHDDSEHAETEHAKTTNP